MREEGPGRHCPSCDHSGQQQQLVSVSSFCSIPKSRLNVLSGGTHSSWECPCSQACAPAGPLQRAVSAGSPSSELLDSNNPNTFSLPPVLPVLISLCSFAFVVLQKLCKQFAILDYLCQYLLWFLCPWMDHCTALYSIAQHSTAQQRGFEVRPPRGLTLALPFNSYVIWHKLPPFGLNFCVCRMEVMMICKMIISKVVSIRRQCLERCCPQPSTAVNAIH